MSATAMLRKADEQKARELHDLRENERALALPAATGDEDAATELKAVQADILRVIGERDTFAISIAESERLDREAALQAAGEAEQARYQQVSDLGDKVILLDCKIIDAVAALARMIDDRKGIIAEMNDLGVLNEMTKIKLNNSVDLRDGVAEGLWDLLFPYLRVNISPGAMSRVVDADCSVLGKPVPPGRERAFNPIEKALSPRVGLSAPNGPAPVNRLDMSLHGRLSAWPRG
jgi:hypothetical protein